jgi:hypothetical protein
MPDIARKPDCNLDDKALDTAVDEAIAECRGDTRAAVRALLIANAYLERARDRAIDLVSCGYVRGRLRREDAQR